MVGKSRAKTLAGRLWAGQRPGAGEHEAGPTVLSEGKLPPAQPTPYGLPSSSSASSSGIVELPDPTLPWPLWSGQPSASWLPFFKAVMAVQAAAGGAWTQSTALEGACWCSLLDSTGRLPSGVCGTRPSTGTCHDTTVPGEQHSGTHVRPLIPAMGSCLCSLSWKN